MEEGREMAERPRARRGKHPVGAKECALAASTATAPDDVEREGEVRGRPKRRVKAPAAFVTADSLRERPTRSDSHFKVGSYHRYVGSVRNAILIPRPAFILTRPCVALL